MAAMNPARGRIAALVQSLNLNRRRFCPAGVRVMSTNEPSQSTSPEVVTDTQATMQSPLKPLLWMLLVLVLLITFGVMTN